MTLYRPRKGTKRKSQATYADTIFRRWLRARDEVCQMASPECWGELQVAHFHKRRKNAVRWDANNAALLCELHHGRFDADEAFKWAWVVKRIGPDELHALSVLVQNRWDKDIAGAIDRLREAS